jgi:hypothetical protein
MASVKRVRVLLIGLVLWAALAAADLAKKALRLAEGQRKAQVEEEHPQQLAVAEAQFNLAKDRVALLEDRLVRRKANVEDQEAKDRFQEAAFALEEAKVQAFIAANKLAALKGFLYAQRTGELELMLAQRTSELTRAEDALPALKSNGESTVSLAEMNHRVESDRLALRDSQSEKPQDPAK